MLILKRTLLFLFILSAAVLPGLNATPAHAIAWCTHDPELTLTGDTTVGEYFVWEARVATACPPWNGTDILDHPREVREVIITLSQRSLDTLATTTIMGPITIDAATLATMDTGGTYYDISGTFPTAGLPRNGYKYQLRVNVVSWYSPASEPPYHAQTSVSASLTSSLSLPIVRPFPRPDDVIPIQQPEPADDFQGR